jgi:hypothetical protein
MATLEGDLLVATGQLEDAVDAYDRALSLPSDDATLRSVMLRRDAAADPSAAALVRDYFSRFQRVTTDASIRARRFYLSSLLTSVPEWSRMGHYLLGRQLLSVDDFTHARSHLELALGTEGTLRQPRATPWEPPAEQSPALFPVYQRAALRALAEATLREGDLQACARAVERWSSIATSSGDKVTIDKWRRRLRFHEARPAMVREPSARD